MLSINKVEWVLRKWKPHKMLWAPFYNFLSPKCIWPAEKNEYKENENIRVITE